MFSVSSILNRFSVALLVAALAASPVLAEPAEPGTGPNYETRLSTIEDQMRALNGRVEQLEFSVHRLDQTMQKMQSDTDARLTKLEAVPTVSQQPTPPPAATAPVPLNNSESPVNGSLGGIKMQDGKVTGAVNNPKTPPLPDAPADYGLTPKEQYDRAFGLLQQADYDGAEKAFKAFIEKNPKEKLLDNAKYWYGETLYVRGRFDDAAIAFADAYQQNPQGTKAPDSLLKLGMSLAAINKTQDACVTLGELMNKYPHAAASVRARAGDELTKLKCSGH